MSGLARTFAGTCIGAGTLTAHWQTLTVTHAAVATQIHQTLDVHGQFAAQVAFHDKLRDFVTQLLEFVVVQVLDLLVGRDTGRFADFLRTWTANTVDRRQADNSVLMIWDEVRVKAFALADNRSAELAEWDEQVLTAQLKELELAEFDVEAIGFEAVVEPEPVIEDEIPAVVDTRVQLGQVWQLGRHRLMCADSTDADAVAKLMNNNKADVVYTDPPYGMNLDTDYTKMGSNRSYDRVIADDKQFDATQLLNYFAYCDEIFLWGADYYVETLGRKYPLS